MCDSITKHIIENASSIEIGTPGKGGVIKVYVDPSKPEDAKKLIDTMIELRNHANTKIQG